MKYIGIQWTKSDNVIGLWNQVYAGIDSELAKEVDRQQAKVVKVTNRQANASSTHNYTILSTQGSRERFLRLTQKMPISLFFFFPHHAVIKARKVFFSERWEATKAEEHPKVCTSWGPSAVRDHVQIALKGLLRDNQLKAKVRRVPLSHWPDS